MDIRFRPDALTDLAEIFEYIAQEDPVRAGSFVTRLRERCAFLADHPQAGRARPELRPDLRSFPIDHYVIFYRILDDAVEIVNIIHSARDIDRTSIDE